MYIAADQGAEVTGRADLNRINQEEK